MFALKYLKHINIIIVKKNYILFDTTNMLDLPFIMHVVSKCIYD